MSYILEALRKAQAERQLGALPTIHAPMLAEMEAAKAGAGLRRPLALAAIATGAAAVALLALFWRPLREETDRSAPAPTPASGSASAAVTAPARAGGAPAQSESQTRPGLAGVSVKLAPATLPAPAALAESGRAAARAAVHAKQVLPVAAPAAALAGGTASHAASGAGDEPVPALRDLPEPIQRAIPPVVLGGYMYSANPSDRLLLINGVLRHEGEEAGPGLMLEKLLPKGAVFSFKGYRYRVPY